MSSKPNGRPPKWTDPDVLHAQCDQYFLDCDAQKKPYTVAGLAVALDTCREVLLDYEDGTHGGRHHKRFSDAIKKSKAKIQAYAEEKLYSNNVTGAIFSLCNNHYRWHQKQVVDNNIGGQANNPISIKVNFE